MIEVSPARKRRYAQSLKKQEADWTSRNGEVATRNMLEEQDQILCGARTICDAAGEFLLDELLVHLQESGTQMTAAVIRSHVEKSMSTPQEHAKFNRPPSFEVVADNHYRLVTR